MQPSVQALNKNYIIAALTAAVGVFLAQKCCDARQVWLMWNRESREIFLGCRTVTLDASLNTNFYEKFCEHSVQFLQHFLFVMMTFDTKIQKIFVMTSVYEHLLFKWFFQGNFPIQSLKWDVFNNLKSSKLSYWKHLIWLFECAESIGRIFWTTDVHIDVIKKGANTLKRP